MSADKFSRQPRLPRSAPRTLLSGSCDCHGHIFPAPDLYPTHNEGMAPAPIETYLDIHRHLGVERGVLVQGGAYRHDNRAMLEALALHPSTLRGVALVAGGTPDADLVALRAAGVRGLRFTRGGASRIADLRALAPRLKPLGFHVELFIGCEAFADLEDELLALGVPVVLDHLAGPFDPAAGLDQPGLRRVIAALASGQVWIKLCPQRNSRRFPDYEDVRPFYERLVEARPDRLVWGSDWPFPNMGHETPDPGDLLDRLLAWVPDTATQQRILVHNPARLYGFEPR